MTDRTPLETLTLARDYLDSLLADSTPGKWLATKRGTIVVDRAGMVVVDHSFKYGAVATADAALIVALHATAPATRELLDHATRCGICNTPRAISIAAALLSTPHAAQWITEREATK